jgi:branched-chain amino acid aminotransferase
LTGARPLDDHRGMDEAIAYVERAFVPARLASVSLDDAGFVQGATITEQLRTFGGQVFALDEHLARLGNSLRLADVALEGGLGQVGEIVRTVVRHNFARLAPDDDLGVGVLVSPGSYAGFAEGRSWGPRLIVHTYRLAFPLWAAKYRDGEQLRTTPHEQVAATSWPAALKCRSRMHYFLADRAARRAEPGARALLCDAEGFVSETSTANVLAYWSRAGLVSPPLERILPGISLGYVARVAESLDIPLAYRPLSVAELQAADEVLLTSTASCVLPVTSLDARPIGQGAPGPCFARLLTAWSDAVGLSIDEQARRRG